MGMGAAAWVRRSTNGFVERGESDHVGAGRVEDIWAQRTPYGAGEVWPDRVDTHLLAGSNRPTWNTWVQSACVRVAEICAVDAKDARCRGDLRHLGPGRVHRSPRFLPVAPGHRRLRPGRRCPRGAGGPVPAGRTVQVRAHARHLVRVTELEDCSPTVGQVVPYQVGAGTCQVQAVVTPIDCRHRVLWIPGDIAGTHPGRVGKDERKPLVWGQHPV